jgi:pimeloyl-ACP methyl ester carboxylesterase
VNSTETASNTAAPTQSITAGDNSYAYRRLGPSAGTPLLFLQHFTGTLDNWDPAVTDPLALGRPASCSRAPVSADRAERCRRPSPAWPITR